MRSDRWAGVIFLLVIGAGWFMVFESFSLGSALAVLALLVAPIVIGAAGFLRGLKADAERDRLE